MNTLFSWEKSKNTEWHFYIENRSLSFHDSISGITSWEKVLRDGIGVYAYQLMEGVTENCDTKCLLGFHDQAIGNTYINLISFTDHSTSYEKRSNGNNLSTDQNFDLERNVLAVIFYQGLFLALNERVDNGWLQIKLFCAWQWYNLVKLLLLFVNDLNNNDGQKMIWITNLEKDMAFAYKYLATMIKDPFYASDLVWLGNLGKWNKSTKMNVKINIEATLRERILRSLFLIERDKNENVILSVNKPCYAPGVGIDNLDWCKVLLHPVFQHSKNNREILRLIQIEMLPQCDFRSAYNMAALLKKKTQEKTKINKFLQRFLSNSFLLALSFMLWVVFFLFFDKFSMGIYNFIANDMIPLRVYTLGYCFILLIPIIFVLYYFGSNILAYLSLPRLAGGIIVGYLFFIFQDDPGQLSNLIIQKGNWLSQFLPIFLLWAFMLSFTYFYIRSDIRPILQDDDLARRRSIFTVGIALSISAVIGLPAIALTTIFSDPQNLTFYLVSPLGKIDLYQYITYMPLSLFAGLITQFIFDDNPITATVWTIEQP